MDNVKERQYHDHTLSSSDIPAVNVTPFSMSKQKRLGPAPIASFEDTIAEDKNRMETSGHKSGRYRSKEKDSPKKTSPPNTAGSTSALVPSTPRIDISRASSHSSHHDSRDSSPENVFEQVGTGTLQDSGVLGYREEGALDLRSSTEELHFMEPEKGKTEREKPQAPRHSPIMYKLDDQQQILGHHQRKDSASSEVAAFLCISGRTSRISSVGSQGSGNSKLSVVSGVSGISRSPSPHRMLLETSFCGPKPLLGITDGSIPSSIEPITAKIIEQVILSRKKDLTEAVLAEGIHVDTASNSEARNNLVYDAELPRRKSDSNANINRKEEIIQPPLTSRSISNKRYIPPTDLSKPIVGVMPSGTEYIRIKLKPDHCYSDNGIADNERILDDDQKKPTSLNLDNSRHRRGGSSTRDEPSVSPKPAQQSKLSRENSSRSPSPATTFSRKNSLCSIFKQRDSASPDSPSIGHARKKNGSNNPHEYRERSRSKSKERESASLNTTPNKQKSVLAIFKPNKKNGAKSKSPSPIEPYPCSTTSNISNVEFKFKDESQSTPNQRNQLRYYDTPLDGKSIHIPLHTPPEEKQFKSLLSTAPMISSAAQVVNEKVSPSTQSVNSSNNCTITIHNRPKPMPPLKCYRIENPDGSITIPLKSPTEEKERDSLWSMEAQRDSSQDSQETVISVAPPQHSNTPLKNTTHALPLTKSPNGVELSRQDDPEFALSETFSNTLNQSEKPTTIVKKTTKERKQLLFAMKMGSGSQEQTFTTQFSISKTESQCSQLSEVDANESNDVNVVEKNECMPLDNMSVVYRNKRLDCVKRRGLKEKYNRSESASSDSIDFHRHSRYIENPEEILNMYQQAETSMPSEQKFTVNEESSVSQDTSRYDSTVKISSQFKNSSRILNIKSTASNDEQVLSSESEKDSEVDSMTKSKHVHCNLLAIEDHESAGLVLQESFDDELPYIPTTLPEERSIGVKLLPMKERAQMGMKTCPLERPRSTTPIHPASLENYCGITSAVEDTEAHLIRGEKLRISLPKKHDVSVDRLPKNRSPRKTSHSSGKNWFEFAEHGINSTNQAPTASNGDEKESTHQSNAEEEPPPPPLPPRKASQQWVDFESIPEKRKPSKRIASLPQQESVDNVPITGVLYNYVKPEECQCECHESERESGKQKSSFLDNETEDQQPLLQQDLLDDSTRSTPDQSKSAQLILSQHPGSGNQPTNIKSIQPQQYQQLQIQQHPTTLKKGPHSNYCSNEQQEFTNAGHIGKHFIGTFCLKTCLPLFLPVVTFLI
ncbi:uncharacterized protein LOC131690091 isoform X4 [Topomyia yanbarensis]|nr:uncharacterized protein LOC131690091 isoform X4 [Topomyia yanbarensis]XP_058831595.1 uncharacterized protein LOC131690091 isoform X4 [Topomyia yanbarensis]XP_058831596.1 uncharacterized protein LOC131690091 isoform X4 [Topomyia yanbarensis]XP_058831597.1 uncharacterized protein LOC131690091 isoform X4 [Topomyia yanbarensis]XP_058831598.1 uncharacterized protein LOC131690091 isoform X4 [Topomyia yanbarensis]